MLGARSFLSRLVDNFGWHFTLLLVSVYLGVKGTITQLTSSAQLPYFKKLKITGDKYQSIGTVAATPWAMKAAIGLLSDTVPLFGYHKKSYILLASVMGTIAFSVLGFVPMTPAQAPIAALLLLLGNLQMAVVDLLCEGKYAEMMVARPESGSDLVSFVWGLYMVGSFLGSAVAGPIADHWKPRYIFLICLPIAAQVILPTFAGWLPEEKLPPHQRGIRKDKIRAHPKLFKLSIVMTIGASVVGLAALLGSGKIQSIFSIGTAFTLCVLGNRWLPQMLARANLYMFLSSMLYVSLPGGLDYFFTAGPECVPGGPNFTFTYYVTYASLVGSIAGAVGVASFQAFLSRGRFRVAFGATCIVKLAASAFDIIIVKRINLRFGIPDKVAFMLGDAIIYQVALALDFLPAVVLTSKVCPKGMESSVYALLASYQNLGSNVARSLGVALIDYLGIKTTAPCNFEKLPTAIFIAHVLLPLLIVPMVFILIPDALMTDDLLSDTHGTGSEFAAVPSEDPLESEVSVPEKAHGSIARPPKTAAIDMELDSIYGTEDDTESQRLAFSESFSVPSFTPTYGAGGPILPSSDVSRREEQ